MNHYEPLWLATMNMRILFTIMITVIITIMTTIIHYRTVFNESGLSPSRRSKRRLWNSRSCQATLVPPATMAMCATWRLGAQGSRQRSEKIWIFPQNPRKVGILLPTSMEKCNSTKHPQTKWVMFCISIDVCPRNGKKSAGDIQQRQQLLDVVPQESFEERVQELRGGPCWAMVAMMAMVAIPKSSPLMGSQP